MCVCVWVLVGVSQGVRQERAGRRHGGGKTDKGRARERKREEREKERDKQSKQSK